MNTQDDLAERIGHEAERRGYVIGVAESLTGGLLVQALARVEGSGDWLAGGIVSYSTAVKRKLLDVSAQKVVSARAVEEMAAAARDRLGADVAVAVSGVGGPASQDGEPPGTVWIGTSANGLTRSELLRTSGSPEDICQQAVDSALRCLFEAMVDD